jgi:NAD(P)-dependent dehydrogenase (short-subunit alcohol dehydrogenase family)
LSESLAAELAPFGVQVTVVEPLALQTAWAARSVTARRTGAYPHLDEVRERLADPGTSGLHPEAAAATIAEVALRPDAPLRLALADAAPTVAGALATQLRELTGVLPIQG